MAAGIPVLEVPVTVPKVHEAIADIAARYPEMVVGAGTVLTCDEARQCIDAGARFITMPGVCPGGGGLREAGGRGGVSRSADAERDHRGVECGRGFCEDFPGGDGGRAELRAGDPGAAARFR